MLYLMQQYFQHFGLIQIRMQSDEILSFRIESAVLPCLVALHAYAFQLRICSEQLRGIEYVTQLADVLYAGIGSQGFILLQVQYAARYQLIP